MFGLWGSVENIVLAVAFDVLKIPSGTKEWCLIGGLAFLTFLGQCAIILAMKAEVRESGSIYEFLRHN